jgi:beta-lactamase class A
MKDKVENAIRRYESALGAGGRAGVWFRHLATGETAGLDADTAFPAASVIKVPILVEALRQAEAGRVYLESLYSVHESHKVGGSGVLKDMHSGLAVSLRDLLTLMIIVSDNTATNMAIDLVGMQAVNETAGRLGLRETALRRKMMVSITARPDYTLAMDNTISARDIGALLVLLAGGKAVSPAADAAALDILLRQQVNDRIPLLLPREARVAHKTGELSATRHDAGIIYGAGGPLYVLAVLTRELVDPPQAARQIAELSREVWEACKPA